MINSRPIAILMADDDDDDRLLAQNAFRKGWLLNELHCVENGEELMDYLLRRGGYSDPTQSPRPGLILLDLNMPRKTGHEAIAEIKADPHLRQIPVIILTTSQAEEDIYRSYDLGANSFITKPVSVEALVATMTNLSKYWFELVKLPKTEPGE
jgi:CheY-like chemotaxis protein